jgi:glucose/arabinose dehydrogenase
VLLLGLLAVAVAIAATAGCSGATSQTAAPPAAPPSASAPAAAATTPAPPAPATTPPADLAHLKLPLTPLYTGLDHPLYLTHAADGSGRLFVVQQGGRVRVIRSGRLAPSGSYLDVSSLVSAGGERGLLGMAFSPQFARNGHVYLDYTDVDGNTVIARYTADNPASDSPRWATPQVILRVKQPFANHNGGCLQFGPDGYLWIGMGDGGSAGDPGNRAQNPAVLLGKMLRIDAEGAQAGATYAIPPGQPVKAGWAPEVWMIGVRNPWRYSFDASGGALWIGDVGQDAWEEIDVVSAAAGGLNLGWPQWEGLHPYRANPSKRGMTFPVYNYPHPTGESISGGYVYRGTKNPALVGTYLFGDYVKGWIGGLRTTAPDGTPLARVETATLLQMKGNPASFGVDEAGELYVVDYTGTVWGVTGTAR